ncbi:MAG: DUF1571 domain-containing protein [Bacteroidetes bacterium]|nr:DUF1571 domain-containing protein [Bacteroidota bacterium]
MSCKEIVLSSLNAIEGVKGLTYHLKITERGKKGFNFYESNVKYIKKPKQVYLYIKGIEVLWLEGKNKGKALVNPNSFPYFNLNLDPMGNLMRQDQHHTLHEMGYDYFATIILNSVIKIGNKFDNIFKLMGEELINEKECYKILIDNKDFNYVDYTVGENESITSIARKLHISEYMIVEKNPKFKDYFDLIEKGRVIKVPNWYCKRALLYIDKITFLPSSIKIEDDKGLFEEYDYRSVQLNPKFDPNEFTKEYKNYKF